MPLVKVDAIVLGAGIVGVSAALHLQARGRDVVVVASFNDAPFFSYQLGFPRGGGWAELFNSDVYDNWVNPLVVGNGGGIDATGGPLHDLPSSAWITIPPRAILVFG